MITVDRSRLPSLHTTDIAVFRRFLLGGVRGFFTGTQGRYAFGEAAAYIGNNDSIVDDLLDIHDALNPLEQLAFQAGAVTALALTVHDAPSLAFGTALNLMLLSGKVRAAELIEEGPKIVRALLPQMTLLQQESLMTTAFDAVLLASTPLRETKNCIVDLIGIARGLKLTPRLSQPALLALASADPRALREHLELMWPWLDAAFGWTDLSRQDSEKEERRRTLFRVRLMKEVFDRVQPSDFINALAVGRRVSLEQFGGALEWVEAADWWSQTLLADADEMARIRAVCASAVGMELPQSTEQEPIEVGVDEGSSENEEAPQGYALIGLYQREAQRQKKAA